MESSSNYTRSIESTLAQVNTSIEQLEAAQDQAEEQQIFKGAEEMLQAMQGSSTEGHAVAIEDAWRRLRAAHNQATTRIAQ